MILRCCDGFWGGIWHSHGVSTTMPAAADHKAVSGHLQQHAASPLS